MPWATLALHNRRSISFPCCFSDNWPHEMDYTLITEELRAATLFDLFRLRAAITLQLEDPRRIDAVRARLRPGMPVSYFDEVQNRLVAATVLELHRTRLLVENKQDQERWSIPFAAVNVDGVNTDISPAVNQQAGLERGQLKVGDVVGFRDRQNRDRYGAVIALNQKTATVLTSDQQKWRVAYQFLFPVIDNAS